LGVFEVTGSKQLQEESVNFLHVVFTEVHVLAELESQIACNGPLLRADKGLEHHFDRPFDVVTGDLLAQVQFGLGF